MIKPQAEERKAELQPILKKIPSLMDDLLIYIFEKDSKKFHIFSTKF